MNAQATVTASVDSDQLSSGEAVQLTLQSDHAGGSQPDLSPLNKDFDILARSTSNSLQIINGQTSSQRQLIVTLAPKHNGQITVPALQWDGEQSAPITVTVSANGGASNGSTGNGNAGGDATDGASPHVFVTTAIDPPTPYVQAAVTLKVRVYSDVALDQASLDLPASNDVLVQQVGKDVSTQEVRHGHAYQVVERTLVLFPQHSGEIKLDGPVLDARMADPRGNGMMDPLFGRVFGQMQLPGGFTSMRPVRMHADPITLNVKPRPPGMANGDWLPARQVTLSEAWQPTDGPASTGQPITRHLSLSALGLSAGQLPDLSALLNLPPGLKAYPDQAKLTNDDQAGSIVGHREQDIAVLADRPGHYEIPAVHLFWWDTASNQRREVTLPPHTLDVVAGSGLTASATPPDPSADAGTSTTPALGAAADSPTPLGAPSTLASSRTRTSPWAWVSLGMTLLWLATLAAWGWQHRQHKPQRPLVDVKPTGRARPDTNASAASARRAFQQACKDNAPTLARDALLAWARAVWPRQPPRGLNALARQLADAQITPLLHVLDRACVDNSAWDGTALASSLSSLGDPSVTTRAETGLPELYDLGRE